MKVFKIDVDVTGESTNVVFLTGQFDLVSRVSDIAKSIRRDGF